MREVDQATFGAAYRDGALVIDVREPYEYVGGHLPGARLVPMAQLPALAGELRGDEPVYVICASGNRSLHAAVFLARAGVDAWSVSGGTSAWQRAGNPIVRGARAQAA